MNRTLENLDCYLLITAHSHAGTSPQGYGPYLENDRRKARE